MRRTPPRYILDPKQPLALPRGSVRAILALLVVTPITALAMTSGIELTGDQFIGLATLVLTAYFVDKANRVPRA